MKAWHPEPMTPILGFLKLDFAAGRESEVMHIRTIPDVLGQYFYFSSLDLLPPTSGGEPPEIDYTVPAIRGLRLELRPWGSQDENEGRVRDTLLAMIPRQS